MSTQPITPQGTPMFGPDGQIHLVPNNQVEAATRSGGEIAHQMNAPDGSTRYVRTSQLGDALRNGGVPASAQKNPYQQAGDRVAAADSGASYMTAGSTTYDQTHPDQNQSAFHRFMSSAGLPTSQGETSNMVQGMLTPQASPDPSHYSPLQNIPVVGPMFRAQREAYDQNGIVGSIPLAGPPLLRAGNQVSQGDYAGASGSALNALTQLLGLKAGIARTPAAATEGLSDIAGRNSTYQIPGPTTDLGAKVSATGKLLGREVTGRIPILNRFESTRIPTFEDYVNAIRSKADPQLALFNNTPKIGDLPPEAQAIRSQAESAANAVPVDDLASTPSTPSTPSTLPRVQSGEGVLNEALTSLDNKSLLKIARSRGIDVTAESQLKPGIANGRIISKIMNDFSPEEFDDARNMGLEIKNNMAQQGPGISPDAAAEAWRYKVMSTFFPDVSIPRAMATRSQATMAIRPEGTPTTVGTAAGAASDTAFFNQAKQSLGPNAPISAVAQLAQKLKMATQPKPMTSGSDLIDALQQMARTKAAGND